MPSDANCTEICVLSVFAFVMQSNVVSAPAALANTAVSATVTGAITAPTAASVGAIPADVGKASATTATSLFAGAVLAVAVAIFLQ